MRPLSVTLRARFVRLAAPGLVLAAAAPVLATAPSVSATPAADAAAAECDPGDVLVGETETAYICMRQALVAPRRELCAVLQVVRADQDAIRALNFAASVETLEAYTALAEEQKQELQNKALSELLRAGLGLSADAVDKVSQLNPFNVNTAISRLRSAGLQNEAVFSAMRGVARTRGKPEMAREYRELLEAIERTRIVEEARTAEDNKALRWALAALQLVQTNPYGDLAVSTAEFGESAGYFWYVSRSTEELTQRTQTDLLKLNSLITRLKGHVARLQEARRRWRAAGGPPDPQCT
jgi:hypothetical protein